MEKLHRKFYFLRYIFLICVSFSINIVCGSLSVHQRVNLDIYRKNCGQIERCISKNIENDTTTSNSSAASSSFGEISLPDINKIAKESYNCKCDENCQEYGDCCVSKANRLTLDNPWRCNRLQDERIGALMVSTCPDKGTEFSKLCMNENPIANSSYNYVLDIPVYSNYTNKLYKNIFCANCNEVWRHQIYPVTKKMICNFKMTSEEHATFMRQAQYEQSTRSWTNGVNNKSCEIYIPEFDETEVHETIPNIRFCGLNSIDYCRYISDKKINNLCHSYTQHVTYTWTIKTRVFKNSHCAECYDMKKKHPFKFEKAACYKYIPPPPKRLRGDTALSHIFDFTLDDSDVGYVKEPNSNNKIEIPEPIRNLNTSLFKKFDLNENCYKISLSENEFDILENGTLIINSSMFEEQEQNYQQIQFSADEYEKFNGTNTTTFSICTLKNSTQTSKPKFSKKLVYLTQVALSVSVVCSALHMILFILLPKLRNPPGRNLFCLTLCLFASQLLFITLDRAESRILCLGVAISLHFLFLASFFWMNVLAFDIWRTFSLEFLVKRHTNDSNQVFAIYNIYAWLCPAIVVCFSIVTEFAFFDANDFEEDKINNNNNNNKSTLFYIVKKIRPMYGFNTCFIGQGFSLFVFFAFPIAILIIANLILFLSTAYSIYKQHREAEIVLKTNESRTTCSPTPTSATARKSNEILMKLYWKLALIMGITWILGFAATIFKNEVLHYLSTFFNGSQGTFIFLAFDCKKKVWQMLRERLTSTKSRTDSSQNARRQKETNTTSAGSSTSGTKNKSN